jgi:hypothetical protein
MTFKPGQEVHLKRTSPMYGKITHVIPEPDGDDSVVVQLEPIRCHASDLELIPALPTRDEVLATERRHGAVIDAFVSNPSDPQRFQELLVVFRERGWLKRK